MLEQWFRKYFDAEPVNDAEPINDSKYNRYDEVDHIGYDDSGVSSETSDIDEDGIEFRGATKGCDVDDMVFAPNPDFDP